MGGFAFHADVLLEHVATGAAAFWPTTSTTLKHMSFRYHQRRPSENTKFARFMLLLTDVSMRASCVYKSVLGNFTEEGCQREWRCLKHFPPCLCSNSGIFPNLKMCETEKRQ